MDDNNNRDMNLTIFENWKMTIDKCYERCSSSNYSFMGVQVILFNRLIIDVHKLFNQPVNYALPMTKGSLEADLRNLIFDAINSHLS